MKTPLLVPRYIVWRLQTDYLGADAAQRRRFRRRVARRLARLVGLEQASRLATRIWQRTGRLAGKSPNAEPQRFPRWLRAIEGFAGDDALHQWPARRFETGPKIVVLAVGSIGDLLQLSPMLRALRETFPSGEICLLHSSPAARMVLLDNPSVDHVATAAPYDCEQVRLAVRDEGAADLVVTVESVSFALSYTLAPLDRRHPALRSSAAEDFLATALAAQGKLQDFGPIFPRQNAKFVWPREWKDLHYLDIQGASGGLAIDRNSALDFVTDARDTAAVAPFRPEQPYVTVQCGVDGFVMTLSRATKRRPTKLLPPETLDAAIRMLQARGLLVIQLGTKDDEPIPAADADLRDRTSLREAAALMQGAVCHVGTEGGLVHLARAVGVPSVVAFGPTSAVFLGYPQNVNLVASDCNSCWWTTNDWFITCPRGFAAPPCMNAHTAESIATAVLDLAANKLA